MNKRKSISKKLRFEIFKRDEFRCQYCGSHPPKAILHVDHIVPVKNGGQNDIDNLITSCSECNLGKSANSLSNIPTSLKEKSDLIKESEAQIKAYSKVIQDKKDRLYKEKWLIAAALERKDFVETYDAKLLKSIEQFLNKLSYFEVLEAAEIAGLKYTRSSHKSFRYFCGICWNKIKGDNNG